MRCLVIAVVSLLCSAAGLRADGVDRDKLIGAWESRADAPIRASWTLQLNGDVLHITRMENDRKVSDFECNHLGRECEVKEAGKAMKVSMWFNGPKLVIMETRGKEVLKRRLHVTDDGKQIEIETIPIVPQGTPESVSLQRGPTN